MWAQRFDKAVIRELEQLEQFPICDVHTHTRNTSEMPVPFQPFHSV